MIDDRGFIVKGTPYLVMLLFQTYEDTYNTL